MQKLSAALALAFLLACCASFRLAGTVQAGRRALLVGDNEKALALFREAAASDPGYVMNFGVFREGVWTYVGRTEYITGSLLPAREALERAVARDRDDYLARLYLGLALARLRDRDAGARHLEAGLRGLYDWLEWITYNTRFGQFWDPSRAIRSEIEKDLAMLAGREIVWDELLASAEWIGHKMEEEIDRARQDEARALRRRGFGIRSRD